MKKYIRCATGDLSLQLFSDAREILDYFEWHNHNLNKRQEEILSDLSDAIDSGSTIAVREAIGNLKFNSKNFTNEQYYIVMDLYNELCTSGGKYESIGRYNDIESSTSTNRSKRNRYVRSNYVSCAERFDPVNSSPEELTEYIYDALDEAFDETNFVEEDLEQYKDTFTNELIKALNRLNLGDMQVETDFGTLTGDTKKIANTVVKAYIQAYKDGRLG